MEPLKNTTIKINTKLKVVPQKVVMLEAELNYTWLTLADNRKHLICATLKNVAEQLCQHSNLYRISRHTSINMAYMKSADFSTSEIYLANEKCFFIARRRKKQFLKFIKASQHLQFTTQNRKGEFIFE